MGLGGTLALLNQKAAQRRPPVLLEWEESEDGSPHKKTFRAELKGKPHPRYTLHRMKNNFIKMHAVDGRVVGRGIANKKKAAKSEAAERALESLGWVSKISYQIDPNTES